MYPPDPSYRRRGRHQRRQGPESVRPDGPAPDEYSGPQYDPRFDAFAFGFGSLGESFGLGFGAGPRPRRGRARRGKLRETILVLLAERPRNGYQIMAEVAERTIGAWQPSPGAVYPCLGQLTEEGLIEAIDLDGQKVYQLTETGQAAAKTVTTEPWASDRDRDPGPPRPAREVRAVFDELRGLAKALRLVVVEATPDQLETIAADIAALKRKLFATLAEPPENDPAE